MDYLLLQEALLGIFVKFGLIPELVRKASGDSIIGSSGMRCIDTHSYRAKKCDRKTVSEASGAGWREADLIKMLC